MPLLSRDYYTQDATTVARTLLGATLVRQIDGRRISGRIVEVEAYHQQSDAASHSHRGQTPRNQPMWGTPGHAYVYFTYGMYWLLNAVCEPVDYPAAVLIRAIEPLDGLDLIAAHRDGRSPKEWTSGPGRLTRALAITGDLNRADLTLQTSGLWIETGDPVPDDQVKTGPRIGLGTRVPEPWLSMPWRWWVANNPHVSRVRAGSG
ncbi:MAG: DNA-3-methyladenine glycosylase [Chloroflexi bacterium]|nr:DNA-3-methyladenine glycosylase [Chloroflexota bacterium]